MPFTKSVEWAIPARPLLCDGDAAPQRCDSTRGDDARRPASKFDGNPLHPPAAERRRVCPGFILDLYDPARSKRFVEEAEKMKAARRSKISRRAIGRPSRNIWRNFVQDRGDGGAACVLARSAFAHAGTFAGGAAKGLSKMRWAVYDRADEAQNFAKQ